MTLQDNDQFMVSRGNTPYSVESQTLVANLQDSDLMLVCRSGVPYKATGAEIKDSLGSGSIDPGLNDITLDPAAPGSGTEADPYILQTQTVAPYGSTAQSVETITIIGQPPEASVVWKDNSVDAGNRFAQVTGELTDASGVWTGKLEYADIPGSTEDTSYLGKLNVGLVYFQWSITQEEVPPSPPALTNVSLVESDPEGDRFTSQSFVASSQVTEGNPLSEKTFNAHVDGTFSETVQFTEPLESSEAVTYSNYLTADAWLVNAGPELAFEPGSFVSNANSGRAVAADGIDMIFDCSTFPVSGEIVWASTYATVTFNVQREGQWLTPEIKTGVQNSSANYAYTFNSQELFGNDDLITGIKIVGRDAGGLNKYAICRGIKINGVILLDGSTGLIFPAATDMTTLAVGDGLSQGATTGTVGLITGTTATLSSSSGTWTNGVPDVIGPQKTIVIENARLYCAFDTDGNITDLQDNPQDPPYTTTDANPGLTFAFPATFPSGQTPDEELPDGTTFTVEVSAENIAGTSGPLSATVQPEPGTPDVPLAGLTTLYTGNGTGQTITTGIDLVNNDGLVWIKCRDASNLYHLLFDTLRAPGNYLFSNEPAKSAYFQQTLTAFNNNGFSYGNDTSGNDLDGDFVAWSFGKFAGYFDVVKYTGTGGQQAVSHGLATDVGMLIVKSLDEARIWQVYHKSLGSNSSLQLDSDSPAVSPITSWGGTDPTDTEFFVGPAGSNNINTNELNKDYIAYLFAEDTPGVLKCGVNTVAGEQVECGFRPQWVLFKDSSQDNDWYIGDNKRGQASALFPNSAAIEGFSNLVFNDTGFTQGMFNNIIYVAIAEPPITRTQTPEEFAETQLKTLTYSNRKQVRQGEEALDDREAVIKQASEMGLDVSQIKKLIGK